MRMNEKNGNDTTRGEIFSPASFAYSPSLRKTPAASTSSLCSNIAELAVSALLAEVWTTPKPGLVDRNNNGAHTDMDLTMFERSALALETSFLHCAEAGECLKHDLPILAAKLRTIGLQAESRMYEATGGVNTHKGAIFSMGILCAAVAMEFKSLCELQEHCRQLAAALLETDTASGTHGLAARETAGTGGIRAEAGSGFDTAFSIGLPALEEALAVGCRENHACIYALLRIIASTEDSNLVHRGGACGMDFAQKEAVRLTEHGPAALDLEEVRALDGEFIKRNLSPGGSADLLAFSIMLYRLKKGDHND